MQDMECEQQEHGSSEDEGFTTVTRRQIEAVFDSKK